MRFGAAVRSLETLPEPRAYLHIAAVQHGTIPAWTGNAIPPDDLELRYRSVSEPVCAGTTMASRTKTGCIYDGIPGQTF